MKILRNSIGGFRLSPAEMAKGRLMRAPDGHESDGGGITAPTGDGNSDQSGNNGSDSNNTGNEFDPAAFWNGPAPAADPAPSGESAGGKPPESGNPPAPGGDFASELTTQLAGLTFGDAIFDDSIAAEINEGNFSGVQGRLNTMGQNIVRQAVAMNVQILKPLTEQILARVREETQQTFTTRDNTQSLETLFPAAKNPVMAKTIQPIYDQALKNAKGNAKEAVAQTKEMLRFMAGESARDLGVEMLPAGTSDRGNPQPNINWLDELTGRK